MRLQRTGWGFFCQSAAGSSGSGTTTLIVPMPPFRQEHPHFLTSAPLLDTSSIYSNIHSPNKCFSSSLSLLMSTLWLASAHDDDDGGGDGYGGDGGLWIVLNTAKCNVPADSPITMIDADRVKILKYSTREFYGLLAF